MTPTQLHDRLQAVDALRRIAHMADMCGWGVNDYDIDGWRGLAPQIVIRHESNCGEWYRIRDVRGALEVTRMMGDHGEEDVDKVAYHDPKGALVAAYRDAVRRYAETYGQERP